VVGEPGARFFDGVAVRNTVEGLFHGGSLPAGPVDVAVLEGAKDSTGLFKGDSLARAAGRWRVRCMGNFRRRACRLRMTSWSLRWSL
jgi:hypothetical protein